LTKKLKGAGRDVWFLGILGAANENKILCFVGAITAVYGSYDTKSHFFIEKPL